MKNASMLLLTQCFSFLAFEKLVASKSGCIFDIHPIYATLPLKLKAKVKGIQVDIKTAGAAFTMGIKSCTNGVQYF